MKINAIPPVRVVPVPAQKFFQASDTDAMKERLEKARAEAWAKPGAHDAIAFSRAWAEFIAAAINEQVNLVASTTKAHLAERDARISALMTAVEIRDKQIERHSEHLQRIQQRIEALERFKADKP